MDVLSIGHSTHTIDRFIELLAMHDVGAVADVRLAPGSRRMPHFGAAPLAAALEDAAIAYVHVKELGGRRRPRPESPNGGWQHEAFRGYADHLASEEFAHGYERLCVLAGERRTTMMCAEALWWRCHRRLVSDVATARGGRVLHIGSDGKLAEHRLPEFAVVEDGRLTYPPAQSALDV